MVLLAQAAKRSRVSAERSNRGGAQPAQRPQQRGEQPAQRRHGVDALEQGAFAHAELFLVALVSGREIAVADAAVDQMRDQLVDGDNAG